MRERFTSPKKEVFVDRLKEKTATLQGKRAGHEIPLTAANARLKNKIASYIQGGVKRILNWGKTQRNWDDQENGPIVQGVKRQHTYRADEDLQKITEATKGEQRQRGGDEIRIQKTEASGELRPKGGTENKEAGRRMDRRRKIKT